MQLALGSLDRLVELVEARGGWVAASEAARQLFAVDQAPQQVASRLLRPLVEADARLVWRGDNVVLDDQTRTPSLRDASFVVFDLETTGLVAPSARICEIGAVRIQALEQTATFETLVAPAFPCRGRSVA